MLAMATSSHKGTDHPGHLGTWADSLVLGTVNAPFKRSIDAQTLASCLMTADIAPWVVHVTTFFTDVEPHLILRFAREHGVSEMQLTEAYKAVKAQTGLESAALETSLVPLAFPA
jgi:hypothetical protein